MLDERQSMINLIDDLIKAHLKMNFYVLVPDDLRKLPSTWTSTTRLSNTPYHSYAATCDKYEINPSAPLASHNLSQYANKPEEAWTDLKHLKRFYTLEIFYLGPLDEDYIWRALPGILQLGRDNAFARDVVTSISKLNDKMYTNMITYSIKPITLQVIPLQHPSRPLILSQALPQRSSMDNVRCTGAPSTIL
jgi:hypothetical protein